MIFEKALDFLSLLWYVVVLTEKKAHPDEKYDKRTVAYNHNPTRGQQTTSPEMKELLGYMSRHHEELEKSFTDEQKEMLEKFHDCWSKYISLAEAAIFEYALKLGARLAIEVATE